MNEKKKSHQTVPIVPTVEMLIAGRKQCMADMIGEHHGPNIERIWKAMLKAAPSAGPQR